VTITNSLIGDNVSIQQGAQVMLSVVSDRCFLPWNATLFMTTLMDNSMVAQLSCLQMCVVGRNTFIGAGNIFTDFNLSGKPLKTFHQWKHTGQPTLENVGLPVIGSAIGHNVRIGSGFVFYPARMIGSNTTLIYAEPNTVIGRNIHVHYGEQPDLDEHDDPERAVYYWPHQIDWPNDDSPHGSINPISLAVTSSSRTRY
jgi:acetyltransferase-like isoleucine patch superfamily enzyme